MSRNRQVATLPMYINHASVEIGDLISVRWKTKDLTHTRMGRVAKRDYEGGYRVISTAEDIEIFRWHPAYDKQVTVTLIEKMAPVEPTLFDMDMVGS